MESVNSYKCQNCGAEYETEKEAIRCEFTHRMPRQIVGRAWPQKKPLPEIVVRMTDGKKVLYRPIREVR